MMAWVYLAIAIICEVVATNALKASEGFSKLVPSVVVVLGYGCAFYCLSLALRDLPLALAYAVWCGLGIVLVALVGWWWFGEAIPLLGLFGILLIICGIGVLKIALR